MVLHDFARTLPIEELWASIISHLTIATISSSIALALALWRSWRFSISPIFYPNDPKELPYWIPIIGHALPFFNNSEKLLNSARYRDGSPFDRLDMLKRPREYFRDTREPFTITIAGGQLHVLTKARDVSDAYKNNTTFSYDGFVQAVMQTFGCSKSCLEAMYSYSQHEPDENDFPNPNHKTLAKLMKDLHVKQLFPGEHLDNLGNKFVEFFQESLTLEEVVKKSYTTKKTSDLVVVPLHAWTSEMITLGGQRVYFGRLLEEIDPEMTRTFLEFDELSSQVLYQYPRFMSGRMNFLKEKLIQDFVKYLGVPAEKRIGDAWFTKAFEHEALQRAVGTQDLATMMTTTYWATNTNTRKACSWMLSYIIYHPELIDIVRIETDTAFDNDGRVNFHYLNDSCPRLSAIWHETIRLTTLSASVRYLSADTIIGGKTLRKNNRVIIPYRQLHFNEEVFGKDVHQFDPERFLKNEALPKSSSWRPFGGGTTMCPGRFVAKIAVVTQVAMLLRRFDVELAEPGPFPRMEEGKPVLGIMSNKEGDDPLITLRKRSTAF